jgi:hypothetical protein
MTDFRIMTKEEAIEYCYEHKNDFIKDGCESGDGDNIFEQFECLISCLESGHITPAELPDYGMDY